jgi:uncharacterized protein YdeI (YjbR/CyaY-like superfamily)
VSPTPTPRDVIYFASPQDLRDWFDANHATARELWVGYYKKHTGRAVLTWPLAVDEALCVGWIDGVRYRIDDDRSAQRFTPRRAGSTWSAVNVAKVAALTEQGRMRPAGIAAFEARIPEKTAVYSYEREYAAFTDGELARFQADEAAWADWQRRPPSYRKNATHWVTSAKRPETRERRFADVLRESAAGRKPRALTPPGERPRADPARPER